VGNLRPRRWSQREGMTLSNRRCDTGGESLNRRGRVNVKKGGKLTAKNDEDGWAAYFMRSSRPNPPRTAHNGEQDR